MTPRDAKNALRVAQFNADHPVGTRVRYWKGAKRGAPSGVAKTAWPAVVACGGVPVIWVEGEEACIALSHVEIVE